MGRTNTLDQLNAISDKNTKRKSLALDNEYHNNSSSEDDSSKIELSYTIPDNNNIILQETTTSVEDVLSVSSAPQNELRLRKQKSNNQDSPVDLNGVIVDVSKREKIFLKGKDKSITSMDLISPSTYLDSMISRSKLNLRRSLNRMNFIKRISLGCMFCFGWQQLLLW